MADFWVTRRARIDLLDIARYTLEEWGAEQVQDYLRALDRRFAFLAERPGVGKSCDEVRAGYRRYPQGSHVVFYRAVEGGIEIVRVLHRAQDPFEAH